MAWLIFVKRFYIVFLQKNIPIFQLAAFRLPEISGWTWCDL
ncbi:hypothetical protein [Alysiella crassa]|nr:hypothetical protein [Alysiella crassa]